MSKLNDWLTSLVSYLSIRLDRSRGTTAVVANLIQDESVIRFRSKVAYLLMWWTVGGFISIVFLYIFSFVSANLREWRWLTWKRKKFIHLFFWIIKSFLYGNLCGWNGTGTVGCWVVVKIFNAIFFLIYFIYERNSFLLTMNRFFLNRC